MVRDTLLGFPSHTLLYRYRKFCHFFDNLKRSTVFIVQWIVQLIKIASQSSRPQTRKNEIIFSRDMSVRENTAQAASVEFVRQRHTNYARSSLQVLCRKNPEGFSTASAIHCIYSTVDRFAFLLTIG